MAEYDCCINMFHPQLVRILCFPVTISIRYTVLFVRAASL